MICIIGVQLNINAKKSEEIGTYFLDIFPPYKNLSS